MALADDRPCHACGTSDPPADPRLRGGGHRCLGRLGHDRAAAPRRRRVSEPPHCYEGAPKTPRLTWLPQPAPAASQRPAPNFPLLPPIGGNLDDEASTRIHVLHPSGLPQPVILGWNADPWAYSSGFAPRSYPRRTPRRGRSLRTGPGTTSSTSVEPPPMSTTQLMRPRVARRASRSSCAAGRSSTR